MSSTIPATAHFVVALLGAESTGKTTLARRFGEAIVDAGLAPAGQVAVVPEYLREFCDRHRRTPRIDEQAAIAAEQTRRIDAAAAGHAVVIADTTALMTAVYHAQVFGDASLYPAAEAAHARADLTLLMALDLPWEADGLQRDGPQVREPVDAALRAALARIGCPYSVIHGHGEARTAAALTCVRRVLRDRRADADRGDLTPAPRWRQACERCGDPACERAAGRPDALSVVPPTPESADRRA